MFAYALNNPVSMADNSGMSASLSTGIAALTSGNPIGILIIAVLVFGAIASCNYDSQITLSAPPTHVSSSKQDDVSRSEASVAKSVTKSTEKIQRNRQRNDYWVAVKVDFGNGFETYVPTIPIHYRLAIPYVRAGGDVFASSISNAYKLAKAVGGGPPARDPAHGGGKVGYWKHYHGTRGGNRIGGHIFYG